MGNACTGANIETGQEMFSVDEAFDSSRLQLENINILDFEIRLKRYAVP